MKPSDDPSIFQFFTEIGIIEQLVRNKIERTLPDGLKMSQFLVLNHLVRLGGVWSPIRLARAFQVTKGAMTNTLQRLKKRGLIEISADPDDGRAKLVELNQAGLEMRQRCITNIAPLMEELSSVLSQQKLATTVPILQNVRKYLDAERS